MKLDLVGGWQTNYIVKNSINPWPKTLKKKKNNSPRVLGWINAILVCCLKCLSLALAGVAQWTECGPVNQKVAGSVPSQGTCLGRRPGQVPNWGHMRGNHILIFLSLSISFSSPLNMNKYINKSFNEVFESQVGAYSMKPRVRKCMRQNPHRNHSHTEPQKHHQLSISWLAHHSDRNLAFKGGYRSVFSSLCI